MKNCLLSFFLLSVLSVSLGSEVHCPPEGESFLPDPEDCSKYWECINGDGYLFTCPSGLFWNTKTNKCDYKENVECTNSSTVTPGTSTSSILTSTGTYGTKTTVSTSTQTSTFTPSEPQTTETTTIFSTDTSAFTPTETEPITSTQGSTFTPNPLCPYPSEDIVLFPDPDDCAKYYECFEGKLNIMDCPPGLLWNQELTTCDYPENVDCARTGTTPILSTTREYTTTIVQY